MGGLNSEVAFLSGALKMPRIAKSLQTWRRQPGLRVGIPSSCWSRSLPRKSPPAKPMEERTVSARPGSLR